MHPVARCQGPVKPGLTQLSVLAPYLNEFITGGFTVDLDMSDGGATPPIPKVEQNSEDLDSFSDSSREPDDSTFTQEVTQVQKRKGGRKPVRSVRYTGGEPALTASIDLCHIRRTQAAKPAGAGRLPGTSHRVHQAAGDPDQA